MSVTTNLPKLFREFGFGANATEQELASDLDVMPWFKRGTYIPIDEALPEVSAGIPQYQTSQIFSFDDITGDYIPCDYAFIPFDIDCADTLSAQRDTRQFIKWLETYKIYDYKIYFSGSKGFHITISWDAIGVEYSSRTTIALKNFVNNYVKPMSGVKSFDESVYHNRSLLRLNNTRNLKTRLYKVRITRDELFGNLGDIEVLATSSRHDFVEPIIGKESDYSYIRSMIQISDDLILSTRQGYEEYFASEPGILTPVKFVEDFFEELTIKPGTRHQVSLCLANYFRAIGLPEDEAIDKLTHFMTCCVGSSTPPRQRVSESIRDVKTCYANKVGFSIRKARDLLT